MFSCEYSIAIGGRTTGGSVELSAMRGETDVVSEESCTKRRRVNKRVIVKPPARPFQQTVSRGTPQNPEQNIKKLHWKRYNALRVERVRP
jgi:hypothetical protein